MRMSVEAELHWLRFMAQVRRESEITQRIARIEVTK